MENATGTTAMKWLRPYGDVQRVENRVGPGTPDMNGVTNGAEWWIENKWLHHFSSRGGPVLLPKFRPEQRVWMRRRGQAGGRVFLLLGIERPHLYLLFGWQTAVERLGVTLTADQLLVASLVKGGPKFPTEEVLRAIMA